MTDTVEAFRQGASALRNARDWAKETRDKLIVAANDRVVDLMIKKRLLQSQNVERLLPLKRMVKTLEFSAAELQSLCNRIRL